MRNYENSDTSSFNTYRSGNENPRRENSYRTDFGSPSSVNRPGSITSTSDHFQRNSVWHQPQDYREMRNQGSQGSYRGPQQDWNQNRNQYNQGNFRNQQQHRWPQDNRQHLDNYGNHSQDRDWDTHRSGDRDYFENRNYNQTWNRWDESARNEDYSRPQNFGNQEDYSRREDYGRGNEYGRREDYNDYRSYSDRNQSSANRGYSADYGFQNPTNQGRGYDENRYQYRRRDHDENQEDEGFFDRLGNKVRDAWNRFTEEEREDQDRANRYQQRHPNLRNDDSRRSYRRDDDPDGPPYSWGSSSSEDYRW